MDANRIKPYRVENSARTDVLVNSWMVNDESLYLYQIPRRQQQ